MNDEHQKVPSYWDMLRMNMRAHGVWRALFTELASWSAFIIGFLVIVGLSLYAGMRPACTAFRSHANMPTMSTWI